MNQIDYFEIAKDAARTQARAVQSGAVPPPCDPATCPRLAAARKEADDARWMFETARADGDVFLRERDTARAERDSARLCAAEARAELTKAQQFAASCRADADALRVELDEARRKILAARLTFDGIAEAAGQIIETAKAGRG